jgi:hypothetical protein
MPLSTSPVKVAPHDLVRIPDGSVAKVIGFYRTDKVAVLVRLDSGDRRQYVPAELRPLD